MSTVKRAHIVSRGYLEGWATRQGRVFVLDKEHPERAGVRSLGDATVIRYAYRTELTNIDLEAEYAQTENAGIPAIRRLASGEPVNRAGRAAVINFLDMHRERSGFADRTREIVPIAAGDIRTGSFRVLNAQVGDRIAFSRIVGDDERTLIRDLPVENWRWHTFPVESGLITGDGAVLLWATGNYVDAVTFPLSPRRLLVIGSGLDGAAIPINPLVAQNSRRWIVRRES